MRALWHHARRGSTALLLILATASMLAAQGRPPGPDGFVPVSPDELGQEQLPATPLVFAAYALVWIVLIVYVFTIWRRMIRLEQELRDVRARQSQR